MMSLQYPIILAHGIARFDHLTDTFLKKLSLYLWDFRLALDGIHYFKGMTRFLRREGYDVYATSVGFADDVDLRAEGLRQAILAVLAETGRRKIHIIGHSMGGLDARHMIVDKGMAGWVASLTTIGTPHLGTSFAEWGLRHGGDDAIKRLAHVIQLDGFRNLTRPVRAAFNQRVEAEEATNDVYYQTYSSYQAVDRVFLPLRLSWQLIYNEEGENDGLVPVHSQEWTPQLVGHGGVTKQVKQCQFPVPADHLNQIGWWDLDELGQWNWWKRRILSEKRRYESKIREVYLQIARGLEVAEG